MFRGENAMTSGSRAFARQARALRGGGEYSLPHNGRHSLIRAGPRENARIWLVFGGADNDAVFDSARADCVSVSADLSRVGIGKIPMAARFLLRIGEGNLAAAHSAVNNPL